MKLSNETIHNITDEILSDLCDKLSFDRVIGSVVMKNIANINYLIDIRMIKKMKETVFTNNFDKLYLAIEKTSEKIHQKCEYVKFIVYDENMLFDENSSSDEDTSLEQLSETKILTMELDKFIHDIFRYYGDHEEKITKNMSNSFCVGCMYNSVRQNILHEIVTKMGGQYIKKNENDNHT